MQYFRFTLTNILHFHNITFRLIYKELITWFFPRYRPNDTAQSFKNSAREDACAIRYTASNFIEERHVMRFMWIISLRLLYAWWLSVIFSAKIKMPIYNKKSNMSVLLWNIYSGKSIKIVMTCFKELAKQ